MTLPVVYMPNKRQLQRNEGVMLEQVTGVGKEDNVYSRLRGKRWQRPLIQGRTATTHFTRNLLVRR